MRNYSLILFTSSLAMLSAPIATPADPATTQPLRATITPAPDTTFFTEPLRPDGTIDYFAALNDKFGHGITPENNAFVFLLKAAGTGKNVLGPDHAPIVALAGTTESQGCFVLPPPQLDGDFSFRPHQPWTNKTNAWMLHSWKAADHPNADQWLAANAPYLDLASKAAACDRLWAPLVLFQKRRTPHQCSYLQPQSPPPNSRRPPSHPRHAFRGRRRLSRRLGRPPHDAPTHFPLDAEHRHHLRACGSG